MAALQSSLIVVTLLFSLHTSPSQSVGEDVHLIEFKESLKNSTFLDKTWIKGANPCDRQKPWEAVDCSDTGYKSVSALLLMNYGLSGTAENIDIDALKNLENLRYLSLENNSFSGPIPGFNRLSSLKSLFLSGNQFSGEIPPDFFNDMGSLKKLELSRNKFSGKIPDSLQKLDNLMELFLDRNEFSGPIPSLEQKSLHLLDLSFNKLQGEVPQTMSRFSANSFQGNADLCGQVLSKECSSSSSAQAGDGGNSQTGSLSVKWVILGLVVGVLLLTILFKSKRKEQQFTVLGKENLDEPIQVRMPSTNRRSLSSSRKSGHYNDAGSHSSRRGGPGRSSNDLVMINEEKGVFGLPDLMKAAAEVLGSGNLGSAYKATMGNGLSVVVKRLRDMNKLNRDAFDAEIRRLGRIRHRNILPPLAYHFRKEEKLLITEYVPMGSLLYLLHGDHGADSRELDWPTRLKIIKGIARGMGFLHTEFANYELPHGNLKSSNILLSSSGYEPLLTDYALYSLISNTNSVQALFAYKCPEAVLYQQLSPKSDVYCLGIVVLEIMTGKFPAQYLNNQKGGTDVVQWIRQAVSDGRVAELIDPEIANASTGSLEQMEKMLFIGATCTEGDPDQRIEMREAIRSIEEIVALEEAC